MTDHGPWQEYVMVGPEYTLDDDGNPYTPDKQWGLHKHTIGTWAHPVIRVCPCRPCAGPRAHATRRRP